MSLVTATCQFPVSGDIQRNCRYIVRQIRDAAARGAEVVHFPECALSGYAGTDFETFELYDWQTLCRATDRVVNAAREHSVWVILGTSHPITPPNKPHNSMYIIDDRGCLRDRYDKRFCAGEAGGGTGDLVHFSPGDHAVSVDISGVRCGVLICHEYRYPELYRDYLRQGVQLMFHSYHTGNQPPEIWEAMRRYVGRENHGLNRSDTIPGITMPAAMHTAAADNYMWISCANSSARESCWPAFMVRPDGVITGKLRRNVTGVLITTVDTETMYYDSTRAWRFRAMQGRFYSGEPVTDPMSAARTRRGRGSTGGTEPKNGAGRGDGRTGT